MNEIKAIYEEVRPALDKILSESSRVDLLEFSKSENMKSLFNHRVDHPIGYSDSFSYAEVENMYESFKKLSNDEKKLARDIANSLITHIENNQNGISNEETKQALLAANQISQHLNIRSSLEDLANDKYPYIKRIGEIYSKQKNIPRIKEWEAQIAENKGMWHAENMNLNGIYNMIGSFAGGLISYAGMQLINPEFAKDIGEKFTVPIVATGIAISPFLDQFFILPLQNLGKSPNLAEKTIKNRHYRISRHPLYGARMTGSFLLGLASLNPIGLYTAAKVLYHGTRACEEQDRRLRIIDPSNAQEYQNRVPFVIPGTKLLSRGLRKFLPENTISLLEKPLTFYLEKIPFIKNEPKESDIINQSPALGYYRI